MSEASMTLREAVRTTENAETHGMGLRQRSSEYAYRLLKQKILDSEYPPGEHVLEQDIARELKISRTPVREAFVRLEQEGLLQIVPRHGIRISVLSPKDMRELYEVLAALEPAAVELLARRRPADEELLPLVAACDAMETALAGKRLKAWATADEDFHFNLAQLCGNRRLAAIIMTMWDQAHRARMFTLTLRPLPKRSTQEHRAVVDAIRAGDVERARELYAAHRRRSGDEMMAIIDRHGFQRL
jgi:DNA-binding GntR family transcriptional regulator